MNCIGNIDLEKSMVEQIEDYEVPGQLGGSYAVKDLKPEDKAFIKGIAAAIDAVDNFEPYIVTGSIKLDEIIKDYADTILADIIEHLLGELGMNLFPSWTMMKITGKKTKKMMHEKTIRNIALGKFKSNRKGYTITAIAKGGDAL